MRCLSSSLSSGTIALDAKYIYLLGLRAKHLYMMLVVKTVEICYKQVRWRASLKDILKLLKSFS